MEIADASRVAELTTQLGYPATLDAIAQRFDRVSSQPNHVVLVADGGVGVVGWIHTGVHPYLEHDAAAEILGLVVDDGHRGQGIGDSLVRAAESWAKGQGCLTLRVRSRIARERAHAFYERRGFQRIKTPHCFEKQLTPAAPRTP